jgi:hypothetical protein
LFAAVELQQPRASIGKADALPAAFRQSRAVVAYLQLKLVVPSDSTDFHLSGFHARCNSV